MSDRQRKINHAIHRREPLSAARVREIALDPASVDVQVLITGKAGLGPETARVLASAAPLVGLECLGLDDNPIGDEGLASLAGSPLIAGLKRLFVSRCEIGAAGIAALANAMPPKLRQLVLDENPALNSEALSPLARLPALEELSLLGTKIDAAGAIGLLQGSSTLWGMTLWRTGITQRGAEQLREAVRVLGRYVSIVTDYDDRVPEW
ncbi:hypothetical protein DB30_00107 [Enhygromyxa salina]|uniref:Leucine Rich repeats (2 copies) n=1 Tax=Enhygromyxa salina TaxID=215803 RepID=A0A0C2A7N0_9BACT|nr:hypothetical protein [Enhygromyxa salina]KIG19598.1 hypothetical protein DB30_00107 [Enhygromyxa salina]